VIQWKVTCDPCMLWQRFGRGARDNAIQATALLFVELKNLDPVAPLEGRKRKAAETGGGAQLKSKRAKKEKPAPLVLDENSTGEEFWKARKEVYHEPISDEKQVELDQVLDDVINAEGRGIGCRRTPFKVYFDNDDEHYGSSTPPPHSTLNDTLQGIVSATGLLTGLALVVRHDHLVSAVISAVRKSLQICFKSPMQDRKPSRADQRSRITSQTKATKNSDGGSTTGGGRPARTSMGSLPSTTSAVQPSCWIASLNGSATPPTRTSSPLLTTSTKRPAGILLASMAKPWSTQSRRSCRQPHHLRNHILQKLPRCASARVAVASVTPASYFMTVLFHLCLINFQLAERSQQCPNYGSRLVGQPSTPNHNTEATRLNDPSSFLFQVKSTSSDPDLTSPAVHYYEMQIENTTNGEGLHHWYGYEVPTNRHLV
jgi:hypothetical protein